MSKSIDLSLLVLLTGIDAELPIDHIFSAVADDKHKKASNSSSTYLQISLDSVYATGLIEKLPNDVRAIPVNALMRTHMQRFEDASTSKCATDPALHYSYRDINHVVAVEDGSLRDDETNLLDIDNGETILLKRASSSSGDGSAELAGDGDVAALAERERDVSALDITNAS